MTEKENTSRAFLDLTPKKTLKTIFNEYYPDEQKLLVPYEVIFQYRGKSSKRSYTTNRNRRTIKTTVGAPFYLTTSFFIWCLSPIDLKSTPMKTEKMNTPVNLNGQPFSQQIISL